MISKRSSIFCSLTFITFSLCLIRFYHKIYKTMWLTKQPIGRVFIDMNHDDIYANDLDRQYRQKTHHLDLSVEFNHRLFLWIRLFVSMKVFNITEQNIAMKIFKWMYSSYTRLQVLDCILLHNLDIGWYSATSVP